MKKLVFLIILSFSFVSGKTQSHFNQGRLYFKISDTCSFTVPNFPAGAFFNFPKLNAFNLQFSVTSISRPYKGLGNNLLDRTYLIVFNDTANSSVFIDSLYSIPYVDFVEIPTVLSAISAINDTTYQAYQQLDKVNALKAFDITEGDSNVQIAIVDVAFNYHHEDLIDNIYTNIHEIAGDGIDNDSNGYIDDLHGWDAGDNDNNPEYYAYGNNGKQFIHGNFVAGMAVAKGNNNKGISGTCPKCSFIPVKILENRDSNTLQSDFIHFYDGIVYAIKAEPDVISISIGGQRDSASYVEQAIFDEAYNRNIIVVAGAGNDNNFKKGLNVNGFYPAKYNHVISVSSIDIENRKTDFSNYGSFSNTDVAAPGNYLVSLGYPQRNKYIRGSGTSMSAPIVAGIFGLLRSIDLTITVDSAEARMKRYSHSLNEVNFRYSNKLGSGLIDAKNLLSNTYKSRAHFTTLKQEQNWCVTDSVKFIAYLKGASSYIWDFGDGNSTAEYTHQVKHKYASIGLYTIRLTILDSIGNVIDSYKKAKWLSISNCNFHKNNINRKWIFGNKLAFDFTNGKPETSFTPYLVKGGSQVISGYKENYILKGLTLGLGVDKQGRYLLYKNDTLNNKKNIDSFEGPNSDNFINSHLVNPSIIIPYASIAKNVSLQINPYYGLHFSNKLVGFHWTEFDTVKSSTINKRKIILSTSIANTTDDSSSKTSWGFEILPKKSKNGYWLITSTDNIYPDQFVMVFNLEDSLGKIKLTLHDTLRNNIAGHLVKLKASPDLSKLAGISESGKLVMFSINRISGTISVTDTLDFIYSNVLGADISFSPDSKLLYLSTEIEGFSSVIQYKLDTTNIESSKRIVIKGSSQKLRASELAPDGIIYYTGGDNEIPVFDYLCAITKPNQRIYADFDNNCGFVYTGKNLNYAKDSMFLDSNHFAVFSLPRQFTEQEISLDTIFITKTPYSCDSVQFGSNMPEYNTRKWEFRTDSLYWALSPKFRIDSFKKYPIKLTSRDVVLYDTFDYDSIVDFDYTFVSCDTVLLWTNDSLNCYNHNEWKFDGNVVGTDIFKFKLEVDSPDNIISLKVRGKTTSKNIIRIIPPPIINYGTRYLTLTPGSTITLRNTFKGFNSYNSFQWYRNGLPFGSIDTGSTKIIDKPGVYSICAYTACGDACSENITIRYSCSSNTYDTTYYDSSGYNFSTSTTLVRGATYKLGGTNRVTGGSTLTIKGNLIMDACSQLIVDVGSKLIIDTAYVLGCSTWQGILIYGNPMSSTGRYVGTTAHGSAGIYNSYISDALYGVKTIDGGFVEILRDTFCNNFVHVLQSNYNYPDLSRLRYSHFSLLVDLDSLSPDSGCEYNHVFYNPGGLPIRPQVMNDGVSSVLMEHNSFADHNKKTDSQAEVVSILLNKANLTIINDNTFKAFYNNYAVKAFYCNDLALENNTIEEIVPIGLTPLAVPQFSGFYLKQTFDGDIYRNLFDNLRNRIEFYHDTGSYMPITLINSNKFRNSFMGIVSATHENPFDAVYPYYNTNDTVRIKTQCNTFEGNQYGWVGTGWYYDQGTSTLATGDIFDGNTDWDLAVGDSSIKYYYLLAASPNQSPNTSGALTLNPIDLDGVNYSSVGDFFIPKNASASSCISRRTKSINYVNYRDLDSTKNIKVYPNPFNNQIEIQTKAPSKIKLFDINGKKIIETSTKNSDFVFSTVGLNAGVYILKVQSGELVRSFKLIKRP